MSAPSGMNRLSHCDDCDQPFGPNRLREYEKLDVCIDCFQNRVDSVREGVTPWWPPEELPERRAR